MESDIVENIEIPNAVKGWIDGELAIWLKVDSEIPGGSFSNFGLTSVEIPNSITSIPTELFWRNELTSVTLPDSVTTIGASAFSQNKLTEVHISRNTKISTGQWPSFDPDVKIIYYD